MRSETHTPRRKRAAAFACLLLTCTLAGCAEQLTERPGPEAQLQDILLDRRAPQGDAVSDRTMSAVLHFLSQDGAYLRADVRTVTVRAGQSEAEAVLRALLEGEPANGMRAVAPGATLHAGMPVVVAEGVATVSLTAAARLLAPRDLFAARLAIVNTLTELPDITYVNVLVEGREEGLDLAGLIPAGALSRQTAGDVEAAWRQMEGQLEQAGSQSFAKAVTIYLPAPGGRAVLPQVRHITLPGAQPSTLAVEAMREISKEALGFPGAPAVPNLLNYLVGEPELFPVESGAGRAMRLSFLPELLPALEAAGLREGVLCALLTHTLVPFVPSLQALQVRVGTRVVAEISAEDAAQEQPQPLVDALLTPEAYAGFLGTLCRLPFPVQGGPGLRQVARAIPVTQQQVPRALVRQLLRGPLPGEGEGLLPAMPAGVDDSDLRAIWLEGDVALVNLSARFAVACQGMRAEEERNVVYALVNLLTEFPAVRRVAFFVEGEQVHTLAGTLEMRGYFLRNPGVLQ